MEQLFEGAVWSEDVEEEQTSELRGILQYNSASGKLYVAADDGQVRCAEARQQLLSGEWAAPSSSAAAPAPAPTVTTLHPVPDLDLTVTAFALNCAGTHAVVAGPTLADPELSGAFLLDVAARRPRPGGAELPAAPLDEGMFSSHPGLRVLQVTWHPVSDRHVAVLTSDATWRLYDAGKPGLAEQTVELTGVGGRRGLGLELEGAVDAPVAFAFGVGSGWDRFSVYFLFQSSAVYTLCPMAPFGARYPSRAIEALAEAAADGGGDGDTAEAWLGRAFQPVSSFLSAGAGEEDVPELHACRPHALDDHSPALVGPLPVATAAGAGEAAAAAALPAPAEDLLLWRFAGSATALAVATAAGPVGVHLVSGGSAAPTWHPSPPQCVVEGAAELRAVRSQASVEPPSALSSGDQQHLALIDLVALRPPGAAAAAAASDNDDGGEGDGSARTPGSKRAALHLDLASPDTLYSVFPGAAYAITLPWLPVLADHMAAREGAEPGAPPPAPLPDALPGARVEDLGATAGRGTLASAAAVGDPLCGSGLVALRADGTAACVRPRGAAAEPAGGGAAPLSSGAPAAAAEIAAQISRIYGDLLQAPAPAIPTIGAAQLGSPEGAKALAAALGTLRSSHVEFAHRAHHDLAERLEQLKAEVEAQEGRAERVAELAARAEAQRGALAAVLRRASWMAENLSSRLHLLAELYWALPRPASDAETAFKREELPAMEGAARRLRGEVAALTGRVEALRRGARPMGEAAGAKARGGGGLPPAQLRAVREALTEHDRAIRAARAQAAALREALDAAAGA